MEIRPDEKFKITTRDNNAAGFTLCIETWDPESREEAVNSYADVNISHVNGITLIKIRTDDDTTTVEVAPR